VVVRIRLRHAVADFVVAVLRQQVQPTRPRKF